jgi:hypothetical protein
LYHQGHNGDFIIGYDTINMLLKNGYNVIALSMPLLGMNNKPELNLQKFGKFKFVNHDELTILNNDNFNSAKLFIEPIILILNYAEQFNYNEISMLGISGGGWTTVLASAIDTRISKSFPVAGIYPLYLVNNSPGSWGDDEQRQNEIYKIANYLDLYIMGAFGEDRKQTQIFNIYDKCCFSGHGYKTYEETIQKIVEQLGEGNFKVHGDDTHRDHKISEYALEIILNELED